MGAYWSNALPFALPQHTRYNGCNVSNSPEPFPFEKRMLQGADDAG